MKVKYITLLLLVVSSILYAQELPTEKKEAPNYSLFRQNENYEYLKSENENPYENDVFDAIKFIPLSKKEHIYLSLGGQIRPRFEYYSNRFWENDANENFYSQRLAFHTNLVFGKHIRVFGEVYHGYTSHGSLKNNVYLHPKNLQKHHPIDLCICNIFIVRVL